MKPLIGIAMTTDITWCQWLPKDDDEVIEKYVNDGWEIRIVGGYHGMFSVLAVKKEETPNERTV